MNILVTGANGFIGKNLCVTLSELGHDVYKYTRDSDDTDLDYYTRKCDFVFHLAGENRPKDISAFKNINLGLTEKLYDFLQTNSNKSFVVLTSSIQAESDNDYGNSKKLAEDFVLANTNNKTYIYRLPNVFGKWSKPNYNTVIATFCHNISRGFPITVNDRDSIVNLVYIDDVIESFISLLKSADTNKSCYISLDTVYEETLGNIVDKLNSFKDTRTSLKVPNMFDEFTKKLYSTYLSFLPKDNFSYSLKMNIDNRGSFTEFLRLDEYGQVSVNISKPGIIKGEHWHHTKNEKFLVVSGCGVVRFRNILNDEILECFVNDEKLEVVDIPVGYTHNIENLGDTDMVTIMWANEYYDKERPDTFFEKVSK